jgi:hypothetical protein
LLSLNYLIVPISHFRSVFHLHIRLYTCSTYFIFKYNFFFYLYSIDSFNYREYLIIIVRILDANLLAYKNYNQNNNPSFLFFAHFKKILYKNKKLYNISVKLKRDQ